MANIEEAVADLGTTDGAGPSDQVHVSATVPQKLFLSWTPLACLALTGNQCE